MRKYFLIGLGGFFGAILRVLIKNISIYGYKGVFPINTFLINISGSFLLALITTVALEVLDVDADVRLGICTGFLGAFTTFSTLCKETSTLISKDYYLTSLSYVICSLFFGIIAAYLGVVTAREVIQKLVNRGASDPDKIP